EEISKLVNKKQILGAITSIGAFVEAPGRIQYRGKGTTIIGSASNNKKKAIEIIDIFNKAQIKTQFSEDIYRDIWSKVIINSGINTIASILDNENGVLLDKNLMEIVREVTNEGKIILQKEGVEISEDIFDTTVEIIKNTSKNINSMLLDLRKGKRTEIDYISGKIVELGNKLDIPAPYNKTLLNMIKYKENEC
ncbi:MAG TPA: 2-dehydropantoate 2-reductase, partial [Methanofastidiosum sp.]|nr:2-dehydropantoate 2-reductase [Methanofastidiosum sp.]